MFCKTSKLMKFRVYSIGAGARSYNNPDYHHDTGKEFTVSEEECVQEAQKYPGYNFAASMNGDTIAAVMLKKVYGFEGKFVPGWSVYWFNSFIEGSINGNFFIRRIG